MQYILQERVKRNGKPGKPFIVLVTENERDFRLAEHQNTQSFHKVERETENGVTIVTLWDYQ
jgi:hypothetical protein